MQRNLRLGICKGDGIMPEELTEKIHREKRISKGCYVVSLLLALAGAWWSSVASFKLLDIGWNPVPALGYAILSLLITQSVMVSFLTQTPPSRWFK